MHHQGSISRACLIFKRKGPRFGNTEASLAQHPDSRGNLGSRPGFTRAPLQARSGVRGSLGTETTESLLYPASQPPGIAETEALSPTKLSGNRLSLPSSWLYMNHLRPQCDTGIDLAKTFHSQLLLEHKRSQERSRHKNTLFNIASWKGLPHLQKQTFHSRGHCRTTVKPQI